MSLLPTCHSLLLQYEAFVNEIKFSPKLSILPAEERLSVHITAAGWYKESVDTEQWRDFLSLEGVVVWLLFIPGELCGRSSSTSAEVFVLLVVVEICVVFTICGGSNGKENADKMTTAAAERAGGDTPPWGLTRDHDWDSWNKNRQNNNNLYYDCSTIVSYNNQCLSFLIWKNLQDDVRRFWHGVGFTNISKQRVVRHLGPWFIMHDVTLGQREILFSQPHFIVSLELNF